MIDHTNCPQFDMRLYVVSRQIINVERQGGDFETLEFNVINESEFSSLQNFFHKFKKNIVPTYLG